MVQSAAKTVEQYLAQLPPDRRAELVRVRDVVRAHLPRGYEEGMLYGMIGWYIPLSRYPDTYNGQPLCLAGLASQKQSNSLYLMTVYGDKNLEKTFKAGFKAAGKKLDMGKSCVRFKTADALALEVIGDTIEKVSVERYIASYEKVKPRKQTATTASRSSRSSKPKRAPAKSGSPSSRSRRRS